MTKVYQVKKRKVSPGQEVKVYKVVYDSITDSVFRTLGHWTKYFWVFFVVP